jgi:hypothetical protein
LVQYIVGILPNFLAAITGIGLVAWEYLQRSSRTLVFDYHDIGATIAGLAVAWLIFAFLDAKIESQDN